MIDTEPSSLFRKTLELGDDIQAMLQNSELEQLETRVPEYIKIIEQEFSDNNLKNVNSKDYQMVKTILTKHKKIIELLSQQKDTVIKDIKQLRIGREMRNTYPQDHTPPK
jgi:hypothetical protein